jgi:hypothetical protein
MHTLTNLGPGFKSNCMTLDLAQARANELTGKPGVGTVEVRESQRNQDKDERFYVVSIPKSENKRNELLAHHRKSREERGMQEGPSYVFAQDPEKGRYLCVAHRGNVYEIDSDGETCTCPDHTDNASVNDIRCKHLVAFHAGLGCLIPAAAWRVLPLLGAHLDEESAA